MSSFIAGLLLGLSLILAIGAQNAFVLKQGLKRHHVFLVCFICAASDAILIVLGISGFGMVVEKFPSIETISRYGGALFLVLYAIRSLLAAAGEAHTLDPANEVPASTAATVMACLAFTWLNPHVYLDTVVLLGSVSTQYEDTKFQFGLGAVSASFLFFFSLGYGARILTPVFQKAVAWRILDLIIALIMLSIAASLVLGQAG